MTSQQDVEIVRSVFQRMLDGEAAALIQAADPEIVIWPRPDEPDATDKYRGLEGLVDYSVNWFGQWYEYEAEPVELVGTGEYVLVVMRERGRMERAGPQVEADFSHSFKLRDGKIIEWRMYDSHAEALEAVGLPASGG
jgi:ketosteroid isomerase-like protein